MKTELKIKILEAVKSYHEKSYGLCSAITQVLMRPDIYEQLTLQEQDFYYDKPHMFLIRCGITCPAAVKLKAKKERRAYGDFFWWGDPAQRGKQTMRYQKRKRILDKAIKRLSKRLKRPLQSYLHTA